MTVDRDPRTVRTPDGEEFEFEVCPAKKMSLWWSDPSRLWSTLMGDTYWWAAVRRSSLGELPVVRERWPDEESARARARELARDIRSGKRPAGIDIRRRTRRRT
jgi:hypothetical protein